MKEALTVQGSVLARNTAINVVGQVLPLLVAVFALPPTVEGLGPARFGVLAIAWAILGYFGEIGFGRATTKFVADAAGTGEEHRLPGIIWGSAGIQLAFGLAGALIVLVAAPLLTERALRIPAELHEEARVSLLLLAPIVPAVLVSSAFRGVLEAAQRFDLINAVKIPLNTGQFLLPLVAVLLGWGLPGVLALLLGARVLSVVAYLLLALRTFPVLRTRLGLREAEWRALIGFGSWVTVSGLVSPILTYLDRFMLGVLVTMSAVTYYTVPFEVLARVVPLLPMALVATLFPAVSTLQGQRQWERMDRLVARSVKYVLLTVGAIVVVLVAEARDLLTLWMGAEFAAESTVALQILAVGFLVNALALVPHAMIQGIGRPDVPAKLHLIELPIQAVLVWVLVSTWGINGAAAAWSLRVTLDAALLFWAAGRLGKLSARTLAAEKLPLTAALMLVFGTAATAAAATAPDPWLRAVLVATLVGVLLVLLWRFALAGDDRDRFGRLLRLAGSR